jgi:predicted P-loop ATPase
VPTDDEREPGDDDDGPRVVPALPRGVTALEPWKNLLEYRVDKNTGAPRLVACLKNVALILSHDADFRGCLAFNELTRTVQLVKKLPQMIGIAPAKRDALDNYIRDSVIIALSHCKEMNVGKELAQDGVEFAARQCRFNPLRDEIDALRWDGVARLDTWLTRYLGVDDTPYARAVGRWWLVSLMARVYQPGCQADHVLVLEGPQGAAKSSALRVLVGSAYFTDQMPDIASKDAQQQLLGLALVEIGEMDSFSRHEVTRTKAFVTVRVDRYRPSYERYVVSVPRTCVFAGSTNKLGYLRDDTGNRRFWPVRVGRIALDEFERDRGALIAEARSAYESGAQWWPARDDAALAASIEDEQDQRYVGDEWEGRIAAWLAGVGGVGGAVDERDAVTVGDILAGLGVLPADWTPAAQQRVGAVMGRLGWEWTRAREHGVRVRRYRRPTAADGASLEASPDDG